MPQGRGSSALAGVRLPGFDADPDNRETCGVAPSALADVRHPGFDAGDMKGEMRVVVRISKHEEEFGNLWPKRIITGHRAR